MSRQIKYTIKNEAGIDCTEEQLQTLQSFARLIGLEAAAPRRHSLVLLAQLFGAATAGAQNPAKVVSEIRALEGMGPASRTKPPTPFRQGPLRGLMHKHYLTDGLPAFALNIEQEIERGGLPFLKRMVRETKRTGEARYFEPSHAGEIARDTVQAYLRRGERGALTGDWLIYGRDYGQNYYLCIAKHETDQAQLRGIIDAMCCLEFPFLPFVLTRASVESLGAPSSTL